MKKYIFIFLGVIIFLTVCCKEGKNMNVNQNNTKVSRPVEGTAGMVSSAHPIATKAGLEILKKGGKVRLFHLLSGWD